MKLSQLLKGISASGVCDDREISCITDNTAKVVPGCVFVCIKGNRFDGHTAAESVLQNGAAAVVTERDLGIENQIIVPDTRAAYSLLCAAYHGNPERKLRLVGVTGTNGKTTSCFVLKSMFETLGHKTGMIGTVKNMIGDEEIEASMTTPDPNELFDLFERMVNAGCEYCVMEVSSQALAQKRVAGLSFEAAVFTNLTRDHLDYHGTFENYRDAKCELFKNAAVSIVNVDDEAAQAMIDASAGKVITFSTKKDDCSYSAKYIRIKSSGVEYELVSEGLIGRVSFCVPGNFSVYNSMGAVICALSLGMDFHSVLGAIAKCTGIPGRLEVVETNTDYTVVIDYAHTPDGLENILTSVRALTDKKVICLFGCGGDRDKTKRPIMGEIAYRYADICVVTSDNPRTENPETIIADILAGMPDDKKKIIVEADRKAAIAKALEIASAGDIVVLAGKGHETYQVLSTGKIHFDEREVVKEILG